MSPKPPTTSQRELVMALSMYAEPLWYPQLTVDTDLKPGPEDIAPLVELGYLDQHDDPDTGVELLALTETGFAWFAETVEAGAIPDDATDDERFMWANFATVASHARQRGVPFLTLHRAPARRRWASAAALGSRRPGIRPLQPGGRYGHHHLGDHDNNVQGAVERLFIEATQGASPAGTIMAIGRLLRYAPRPELCGVNDWGRALRADEDALIWGNPMTDPEIRRKWLERADEIATSGGTPLFGENGFTRTDIERYL